eukprot:gene16753-biopygen9788
MSTEQCSARVCWSPAWNSCPLSCAPLPYAPRHADEAEDHSGQARAGHRTPRPTLLWMTPEDCRFPLTLGGGGGKGLGIGPSVYSWQTFGGSRGGLFPSEANSSMEIRGAPPGNSASEPRRAPRSSAKSCQETSAAELRGAPRGHARLCAL